MSARSIGWVKRLNGNKVCMGAPVKCSDAEISRKLSISKPLGHFKLAKSFADAKLALRGHEEVTRRDGLSSWRVILFVAAGMLSGN